MDHWSRVRDWLDTAKSAAFLPFEVIHPEPTDSSLSGFGGGSYDHLHCGIAHTIGGYEISIETIVGGDPGYDYDSWIRRLLLGAVQSQLGHDLILPLTLHLTFEEQSAEVLVDGNPVMFRGIAGDGLDWNLRADIDSETAVVIQGCAGSSAPKAIRRRKDLKIAGLVFDS